MDETRFLELLSKKRSGAITLLEQKELNDLIQANPAYGEMAGVIDDLYHVADNASANSEAHQQLWNTVQARLHTEETEKEQYSNTGRRRWINIAAVAASLLAVVALAAVFYNQHRGEEVKSNIVSTKKGSKTKIILPDGSEVWLNADSKISYTGASGREIMLEGEAFFDVKKDPDHPFVVITKEMAVTVLGTSFDVRAYPGETNEQTTLIKGAVEVMLKGYGNKKIVLAPYEKISVNTTNTAKNTTGTSFRLNNSTEAIRLSKVKGDTASAVPETQWIKNTLVFDDKPFDKIALEIERWYDVKLRIQKEDLKEKRFNGVFNDRSLVEVLEALGIAGEFHFKIENKTVTIY